MPRRYDKDLRERVRSDITAVAAQLDVSVSAAARIVAVEYQLPWETVRRWVPAGRTMELARLRRENTLLHERIAALSEPTPEDQS